MNNSSAHTANDNVSHGDPITPKRKSKSFSKKLKPLELSKGGSASPNGQSVVETTSPDPQEAFGKKTSDEDVAKLVEGQEFIRFQIYEERLEGFDVEPEEEHDRGTAYESAGHVLRVRVSTIFLQMQHDAERGVKLVWDDEGRQQTLFLSQIRSMGQDHGSDELLTEEAMKYRGSSCFYISTRKASLHLAVPGKSRPAHRIRQLWLPTLHAQAMAHGKTGQKKVFTKAEVAKREQQIQDRRQQEIQELRDRENTEDPDSMSSQQTEHALDDGKRIQSDKTRKKVWENEVMMKCLNIGLRVMLKRAGTQHSSNPKSGDAMFEEIYEQDFPPEGDATHKQHPSPPHKLDKKFSFKDYHPDAFYQLRAAFGVSEEEYFQSMCTDSNMYLDFVTNSKSGSFFFFTEDRKYMIKSQPKTESKFFRKHFPRFFEHYMQESESLLARFVGLHRVDHPSIGKIHFIVMRNVFGHITKKVTHRFDLKGSTHKRQATKLETLQKTPVYKDNDFIDMRIQLPLTESKRKKILSNLKKDTDLLTELNIMDYSLLIGISENDEAKSPQKSPMRHSSPIDMRKKSPHPSHYGLKKHQIHTRAIDDALHNDAISSAEEPSANGTDDRLRRTSTVLRRQGSIFLPIDKGITSVDGSKCYYMGIIDILQDFNAKKKTEYLYKRGKASISCQPPHKYAKRFMKFFEDSMPHEDNKNDKVKNRNGKG